MSEVHRPAAAASATLANDEASAILPADEALPSPGADPASTPAPACEFAGGVDSLLFEGSPDCVKLLDGAGRLLSMNQHGQYAMEIDDIGALMGRTWTSLWPEEGRPLVTEALAMAARGTTGRFKSFCPTVKGSARWWDVVVSPIAGKDGPPRYLAVSRDVTAVHLSNDLVSKSQERLRLATDASNLGLWAWDPVADTVRWENDRPYQIFGRDVASGSMSGADFVTRYVHPDFVDQFSVAVKRTIEHGDPFQFEARLRAPDRGAEWVEFSGRAKHGAAGQIEILGTVADITARKRAETSLFESRQRLEKIITQAATGVVQADILGNLTLVNDKFCSMLGYSEQELIGHPMLSVTAAPFVATTSAHVDALIATGVPFVMEKQYRCKDGSLLWATSSVNALRSADGAYQGLVAIIVDISERHAAVEKLKEADRRKDEFLAMLAHELRNPLAPIGAAAEILNLASFDEARVRKTGQVIRRQVRHMTGLIDDLLDVSRVTRGLVELDKKAEDIVRIVTLAVEQVAPLMQAKGHRLDIRFAPQPAMVLGDNNRLVQVFANLLNNAAKYTPDGGQIAIETAVDAGQIAVSVQDNGSGIETDLMGRLFDLFSQANRSSDRSSGGLGIGLALVKSLVELHGGSVGCTSAGLGQGSTFTVCLPRLLSAADAGSGAAVAMPPDAAADGPGPAGQPALRILVVDDNVDAAQMLSLLLAESGHQVVTEYDAARALLAARQHRPDVCLLDIGLPGMDGNELVAHLRRVPELRRTMMVAVTGYGSQPDRDQAHAAGFDHYLVKPVDPARLTGLMAEAGKRGDSH